MTYDTFINNILETRGRFACGDEYHERHHIVPKCCGGTNEENNLIDLYAREHFIAHKLLALENPDNYKLTYAWSMMAFPKSKLHSNNRYELSPEEYEEVRNAFSKASTGHTVSENSKKKMSDAKKGKYTGEKCHRYGKHLSEEAKQKISIKNKENFSGEKNPFYGIRHTDKTKEKISKKNSKKVICVETGVVYESMIKAEKETGIDHTCISDCCRKKTKTAGSYHWDYYIKEEVA